MINFITQKLKPFNKYSAVVFILTIILIGIGLVTIYSATGYNHNLYYPRRQLISFIVGFFVFIFFTFFPHKFFSFTPVVYLMFLFTFILLLIVLIVGLKENNSVRWLAFGPITFQPSEIARFTTLIYLTYSLSKKSEQNTIKYFRIGVLPHLIFIAFFFVPIILQPDYSSAILLVILAYAMMFFAKVKIKHLVYTIVPFILLIIPLLQNYHLRRIMAFLNPDKFKYGVNYQTTRSMLAFANGKISGLGIGEGIQKLGYMPETHTDFILTVIGEETGFIGLFVILSLYLVLIFMGFLISSRANHIFSKLMGIAISINIMFLMLINVLVVFNLIPVTGMVLPFISYGGSSLIINMACVGMLMNIAGRNEAIRRKTIR